MSTTKWFPTFRRWMLAHNKAWFSPAAIRPITYKDLPNKFNWDNSVKAFDLRYWYISTGLSRHRSLEYTHDIENLHNELNYLHAQSTINFFTLFDQYWVPNLLWPYSQAQLDNQSSWLQAALGIYWCQLLGQILRWPSGVEPRMANFGHRSVGTQRPCYLLIFEEYSAKIIVKKIVFMRRMGIFVVLSIYLLYCMPTEEENKDWYVFRKLSIQ